MAVAITATAEANNNNNDDDMRHQHCQGAQVFSTAASNNNACSQGSWQTCDTGLEVSDTDHSQLPFVTLLSKQDDGFCTERPISCF